MKVAIVYDRVNKWGGAERVLLALHKIFPKAPLYTSVYDKKKATWAKVFRVQTSFLQKIPFAVSHHEFFSILMPLAFASFSFKKFDLVISVTSEFAKGITTVGKTKHLCICLTPTRYLWSGYAEYFPNNFFRFITFPFVFLLRKWDQFLSKNPGAFIAISQEVQKRIKRYYKRGASVIYPPVTALPRSNKKGIFLSGYFLVVSRISTFTRYKRIDLAVKAATKLRFPLLVIGEGNTTYLRHIAGPTVQFIGKVTDKELATYYAHARALIFPAKEDFGLTMVEAMSFGKPVVAYKSGGALEIVKKSKTGTFFPYQTVSSLVQVLKTFRANRYNSIICKKQAAKFSEKVFREQIRKAIKQILKK